jgi:hypothetical protein
MTNGYGPSRESYIKNPSRRKRFGFMYCTTNYVPYVLREAYKQERIDGVTFAS